MGALITAGMLTSAPGSLDLLLEAGRRRRSSTTRLLTPEHARVSVPAVYSLLATPLVQVWPLAKVCARTVLAGLSSRELRGTHLVVGTGMREQRASEQAVLDGRDLEAGDVLFEDHVAVTSAQGRVIDVPVTTICGACSASGTALGVALDMIDCGVHERVGVVGVDAMSLGMLAMLGRLTPRPSTRVRPFDRAGQGVVLGEGGAAMLVEADPGPRRVWARVASVGMSCDAVHPTAPDPQGIERAIRDAWTRAGVSAGQIDLVIAHGTGTVLNDPVEAQVLARVFAGHRPLVTALKGLTGHTSGASMLMSVLVAARIIGGEPTPGITGLREPIPEARELNLVRRLDRTPITTAQVNAFGFGGANTVAVCHKVSS